MVKVSIIVAVFNAERTLERCIDSLVQQSLKDIEIILIDDASTDGSYDRALSAYGNNPRVSIFHNHKNIGLG